MQAQRAPILLGVLFLVALALNSYLLFSVLDGVRIVQQVETQAGHALSCAEFYEQRAVNDYFYPRYARRGDVIYLYSLFAPLRLFGSGFLALALSGSWRAGAFLRWLPILRMGLVLLLLVLSQPTVDAIACATE